MHALDNVQQVLSEWRPLIAQAPALEQIMLCRMMSGHRRQLNVRAQKLAAASQRSRRLTKSCPSNRQNWEGLLGPILPINCTLPLYMVSCTRAEAVLVSSQPGRRVAGMQRWTFWDCQADAEPRPQATACSPTSRGLNIPSCCSQPMHTKVMKVAEQPVCSQGLGTTSRQWHRWHQMHALASPAQGSQHQPVHAARQHKCAHAGAHLDAVASDDVIWPAQAWQQLCLRCSHTRSLE